MCNAKWIRSLVVVFTIVVLTAIGILAHSGRTDRYGGHNDRKTGGYHYHNAGSAHASGNSYQNHTKCGICSTSKKVAIKKSSAETVSERETITALQIGLRCLGYEISTVNGVLGKETRKAIEKLLYEYESAEEEKK